jgi:hypothetical protein
MIRRQQVLTLCDDATMDGWLMSDLSEIISHPEFERLGLWSLRVAQEIPKQLHFGFLEHFTFQ